jgi:hypothetical protein
MASTAALSGGSNRATTLSLNACPYRANSFSHHRPLFIDSIRATTILTRGAVGEATDRRLALARARRRVDNDVVERQRCWRRRHAASHTFGSGSKTGPRIGDGKVATLLARID